MCSTICQDSLFKSDDSAIGISVFKCLYRDGTGGFVRESEGDLSLPPASSFVTLSVRKPRVSATPRPVELTGQDCQVQVTDQSPSDQVLEDRKPGSTADSLRDCTRTAPRGMARSTNPALSESLGIEKRLRRLLPIGAAAEYLSVSQATIERPRFGRTPVIRSRPERPRSPRRVRTTRVVPPMAWGAQ
jgi:hypothetical protein